MPEPLSELDFIYAALAFFLTVVDLAQNAAAMQAANLAKVLEKLREDVHEVDSVQRKIAELGSLIRARTHRESFGL